MFIDFSGAVNGRARQTMLSLDDVLHLECHDYQGEFLIRAWRRSDEDLPFVAEYKDKQARDGAWEHIRAQLHSHDMLIQG